MNYLLYNHPATLGTGYGARMLQLRTGEEEQEEGVRPQFKEAETKL